MNVDTMLGIEKNVLPYYPKYSMVVKKMPEMSLDEDLKFQKKLKDFAVENKIAILFELQKKESK